ncbi:MAG: NUDIX hydrolase [Planctomycetes bacterium]|nr:NUDIX hydrolase [Planctomycetota bacterium]
MATPVLELVVERFKSPRFNLVEESWSTRDGVITKAVIHHPGAVAVLAQPDERSVVLVRQFRYAVRRWTLEIPAGTRSADESAADTARRELLEETGYTCERLTEIMRMFPAVGVSDEELILFRAEGLTPGANAPEPGELVSTEVVAISDLPALHGRGDICDAKTIIALAILGSTVVPRPGA